MVLTIFKSNLISKPFTKFVELLILLGDLPNRWLIILSHNSRLIFSSFDECNMFLFKSIE